MTIETKCALALVAAVALVEASPSSACSQREPTAAELRKQGEEARERALRSFEFSEHIVYGVVTKPAGDGETARFKILHVYKGALHSGETIDVQSINFWKLHIPDCPMYVTRQPVLRRLGEYGVLAFNGERPYLDFVDPCTLDYWFRKKWIARQSSAQRLFGNGSGTTCPVYNHEPIAGLE